jgi:hypothetical protein
VALADGRGLADGDAAPRASRALGESDGERDVTTPPAASPPPDEPRSRDARVDRETRPYAPAPVRSATTVAAATQPSRRGQRRTDLSDCVRIALRGIADAFLPGSKPMRDRNKRPSSAVST